MKKIERKDFLKIAGGAVAGGAAGMVFSGAPFNAFQWVVEWTQDQHVPPTGAEKYLQSVCQECPAGCDISVRMIGERAVKIETSNDGCPVGQELLQMLYHPERIKTPLKRDGKKGSGYFKPVKWEDAIKDIASQIDKVRKENKSGQIAAINGKHSQLTNQLLHRLVKAAGSDHIYHDSCFCSLSKVAVNLTQKVDGSIHYDLENSDFVLSFGARMLEGWGDSARMTKAFLGWKKTGAKFVQVDTICTRTASMADQWVPVKAGTESILALGIAYQLIMKHGKSSNLSDLSKWSGINEFAPSKVSEMTGVPVAVIEQLAKDFVSSRKPVAVAGKGGKGVSASVGEIIAVQCLNKLVANFGKQGGVFVRMKQNPLGEPKYDAAAQQSLKTARKARGLDEFIKKTENIEVLFINEANPVHKSVFGADMAEKMKKIPLVISFMPLINDTAVYSDYIFPTLSSLEMPSRKGDPITAPRFQSKHTGDVIISIGKAIGGVKDSFPWESFKDVMKLTAKPDIKNPGGFTLSTDLLKNHFADLKKKMMDSAAEFDVAMIPYEVQVVGDGSGLALPYVLKSVNEYTMKFGKLVVQMNPETAKKCGVCEGSTARIVSKRGKSARVKVHLSKTIAPDVVAVPVGFGHEAYTAYGTDKGMNPMRIMSDGIDTETGTADWWYTRVKIS